MRRLRWLMPLALAGVALSVLGVTFTYFFAPTAEYVDERLLSILKRGTLRVGMDASFPPFESLNAQQELVGFDVELVGEVGRRMNLQVEFQTMGFDALYEALAAQQIDVIVSALPYERLRTRDVAYSDIYFRGGETLLKRADDALFKTSEDLRGHALGVEWGSNAETVAKKLERRLGYRVVNFPSPDEAVAALEKQTVRALLMDAVSARLLRRANPRLSLVGEPLNDEPNYVMALPIDSPGLLKAVNQQLRAMERDGTLRKMREKWF